MTNDRKLWIVALATSPALCLSAAGQTEGSASLLSPPPPAVHNRIGLGFRLSMNLTVDFENMGFLPAASDPGLAFGNRNRSYDNGYSRVDVSGNNHGPGFENTTWNWGYENSSQVASRNGTPQSILFHSSSSKGASTSLDDDPEPGFELTYSRALVLKPKWRGGIEWAFGYTDLEMHEYGPLRTDVPRTSDRYSIPAETISGQPLPPPGFRGDFIGPRPVIDSTPSRTLSTLSGYVIGSRSFGSDLFCFRLGPYIEVPLSSKIAAGFGGGAALVYAHSEFIFDESVTVPGRGTYTFTGNSSNDEVLPGGYVTAAISAEFAENWAAFASAQLFSVGDYTHDLVGRRAVLDLSKSIFVTIGLAYSF
ncbi:MAG TPA: hypothetical protein VN673_06740 [Clostridia bacterium]|nr:hypothetical protein [Clostridia bacterium]